MTDSTQHDLDKKPNQPEPKIRELIPFKINGVIVQPDNKGPCDADFEWMSDNRD